MKKTSLMAFLALSSFINAQEFEEHSTHEGVYYGTSIWVEKENSTYQDIVIVGYDNNFDPQGTVVSYDYLTYDTVGTKIMGYGHGLACQVDANNDGIMDFITAGADTTASTVPSALLYIQNQNGIYTETTLPFEGVTTGAIEVADLNDDGFDDIVIIGQDSNGKVAKLFLGNGNSGFTEHTTPFFVNIFGDIEIFDANNDNKLDVLITGYSGSNIPTTTLYLNDGSANFTEHSNTGLVNVYFSGVSAADFNNDGNTDLLINGMSDTYSPTTAIFLNDGTGVFTELNNTNLDQLYFGTADFIDFNLDGQQDVFLTGMDSGGNVISALYTNNNGTLTEDYITSNLFENVYISSVHCSDFDHDGDKDILISGFNDANLNVTKVYENKTNQRCVPVYSSGATDYDITNITFREIDNTTPANNEEYEDFSTILTPINRGEPHQISVTGTSPNHPSDVMVYIDFNKNNDYSDPGEAFYIGQMTNSTAHITLTQNIYFEDTTQLGYMRMRIIKSANTSGQTNNSIIDPCQQDLTIGQTEDYMLFIQEPPFCPLPTQTSYNIHTNNDVEFNWYEPANTGGFNFYNWYIVNVGDSVEANTIIQSGTEPVGTTYTIVSNLPSGDYDFIITTDCGTDVSNYLRSTISIEYLNISDENLSNIVIYPNPAREYIKIESEKNIESYTITNSLGKILQNGIIHSKSFMVNLQSFDSGIYFLRLNGEKRTFVQSIIVE